MAVKLVPTCPLIELYHSDRAKLIIRMFYFVSSFLIVSSLLLDVCLKKQGTCVLLMALAGSIGHLGSTLIQFLISQLDRNGYCACAGSTLTV